MYTLPKSLEQELKQPLGRLVQEPELLTLLRTERFLVSVGDRVTYTMLSHGFQPKVCIVDYVLERKAYPEEMRAVIAGYGRTVISVRNPKGTISDDLWKTLQTVFERPELYPVRMEVDGEEDLASLAAIALAPGGATIIYGLPNKGVVVVTATPEHKKTVDDVLRRM